jgi:hypothetical protein
MRDWLSRLQNSWRDAVFQAERQTAAALTLPLEEFFRVTANVFCGLGVFLGLVLGAVFGSGLGAILGAAACGLIGHFVGVLLNLFTLGLVHLIPDPFAWLARRLGYAR